MHGTLQPGGRSPKQANGLTSTSQLKPGSENVQSSGTSFPSQLKGKKRERADHSTNTVKRERFSRTEDVDSTQYKAESSVKSDVAKITEKGGLVDVDGVEKLVLLMQPDRAEKKIDLINRSMLASVIAATEKVECLNQFVQLRGLPILDEWLQEIHKGKVGSSNSSRDGDKSVEEFLLVLLHALDKLPVNLHALQTCNIGRSVNHLRSHKNFEIQRKARSLVDTWKKRVEAEMNSIDAKSCSTQGASVWSSKTRLPEVSLGESRTPSGSDGTMKSSITQHFASKATSGKSSHGESNTKSASSSPGPAKPSSPPVSVKGIQPAISVSGTPDVPLIREDRSSSSNQSHNYSQSSLGKDEGKSSGSVSAAVSKISSSSSRNRKVSGFPATGGQKEDGSGRSSLAHRDTTDKLSQSALMNERVLEGSTAEVSNHKLIVKIPNMVQSPTQGITGVFLEDPSNMSSQASPQVFSDKLDQFDSNSKEKSDAHQCNATSDMYADSCRIDGRKDISTGSGDGAGAGSPSVIPGEEKGMSTDDFRRSIEVPEKNQLKCGKLHEISFSALIESCAKYSEAHSSLSLEDDVGMNLLASVATGETSRSELFSPTDSTERSTPAIGDVCFAGDEAKSNSFPGNQISGSENQFSGEAEGDDNKQAALNVSWSEDGLHLPKQASLPVDVNCGPSPTSAGTTAGVSNKAYDSTIADFRSSADRIWEVSERSNQKTDTSEKMRDSETNKEIQEEKFPSTGASLESTLNGSNDGTDASMTEDRTGKDLSDTDKGKLMVEVASSNKSYSMGCKNDLSENLDIGTNSVKKLTAAVLKSEFSERANDEKLEQNAPRYRLLSDADNEVKVSEGDELDTKSHNSEVERDKFDSIAGSYSLSDDHESHNTDAKVENKDSAEHISLSDRGFPAPVAHDDHKDDELKGSKSIDIKVNEAEPASTVAEVSFAAAVSDPDAKVKFDLNEGFTVDDGKYGEPVNFGASASTTVQMTNRIPTIQPASITVAAAAKGPFLPPEDLLRNKGELGWKGSAATSAFRRAEPRKVIEMSLASTILPYVASTSKSGRAMLDIDLNVDLNVPDERVLEELGSRDCTVSVCPTTDFFNDRAMLLTESSGTMPVHVPGGIDFDLNRVDESNENGQCFISYNHDSEGSMVHVKPLGGLPSTNVQRVFDLNDRPGVDDATAENLTISQQVKVGIPSQLPSAGTITNHPGVGSFSSWFSPGNTYTTLAIPSVTPDQAGQPFPVIPPGAPQRMFGPTAITPFTPDIYRGSVLSSSPAASFRSSPYQFPMFPFGSSFPLPSSTFPAGATSYADSLSGVRLFAPPVHSHMVGPVGAIPSHFHRSHAVCLPESSSNIGMDNTRNWGRQCLDLNAGPGAAESEVREDILPPDEQTRMYPVSGNILKRTEPDGGLDKDGFRHKQSSWK